MHHLQKMRLRGDIRLGTHPAAISHSNPPEHLFFEEMHMAATMASNPVSDLMYDWLTVLQNKAEGVNAYEKYIKDAEAANAPECVAMLKRLHEQDVRILEETKKHVFGMIAQNQGGK
jgi:hypothetical protein